MIAELGLTGAAAVVLAACANTTKPGVVGVQRQQMMLVSADTVERMALVSYTRQNRDAQQAGKLVTKGPELERLKRMPRACSRRSAGFATTPPSGTGRCR
jgi:hypothetical protein